MVFVRYSQNIRRHNAIRRDELVEDVNFNFQVDFQSVYFYIDYIDFIVKKIQYINASLLNLMFFFDLNRIEKVYPAKLFSIHCLNTSGLKLNSEEGISILCFPRRTQQVIRPLHCDVEGFDCDSWKWTTNDVYFQSCQLMYRGIMQLFLLFRETPKRYIHYTSSVTVYLWFIVNAKGKLFKVIFNAFI